MSNYLEEGVQFAGKYEVVDRLGGGKFTEIYLARQSRLDREVAIKLLALDKPHVDEAEQTEERWVDRFEQEAQIVSQLKDPHTVTIHDYGLWEGRYWYIVFEHVPGDNLHDLIDREGRLEADRVVRIVKQVLSSLEEAHEMGVLHRDIKPSNIMVYEHMGDPDRAMLLDFGIAKPTRYAEGEPGRDMTTETVILGTPRYMLREQVRREELTPAADLYALGLVMWEMLTGRPVVEEEDSVAILSRQVDPEPFEMSSNHGVPEELCRVIRRMVEKDPGERYQSAGEVREALEEFEEGRGPGPGGKPVGDEPESADPAPQNGPMAGRSAPALKEKEPAERAPESDGSIDRETSEEASKEAADEATFDDTPVGGEGSGGPSGSTAWVIVILLIGVASLVVTAWFYGVLPFGPDLLGRESSSDEMPVTRPYSGENYSIDGIYKAVESAGWESTGGRGFVEAKGARRYVQQFEQGEARLTVEVELSGSSSEAASRIEELYKQKAVMQFGGKVVVLVPGNPEAEELVQTVLDRLGMYRAMVSSD